MHNDFDIPVTYNGKELSFPAKLLTLGYIFKIEVIVHDTPILFERDDEGEWRALLGDNSLDKTNNIDIELLRALSLSLDKILA